MPLEGYKESLTDRECCRKMATRTTTSTRGVPFFLLLIGHCFLTIASSYSSSFATEEPASAFSVDSFSEIIQRICAARKWNLDRVHVLGIDYGNAKFAKTTVFELELQAGKRTFPVKFVDDIEAWQSLSDLDSVDKKEDGAKSAWKSEMLAAVLEPFQLSGPVKLSFESAEVRDFQKVNVAIGSSVRVEGAREVSLAYPVELPLPINHSSPMSGLAASISLLVTGARRTSEGEEPSMLSLHIMGPTLSAHVTEFPSTAERSTGEELNSEVLDLYNEMGNEELEQSVLINSQTSSDMPSMWGFPFFNYSNSQLSIFDEIIKLYLGSKIYKKGRFTVVHAKVAALSLFWFELEIGRELAKEDFDLELWPEWRTRPKVTRHTFEILAKLQGTKLVPVVIRPLKHYRNVESFTWRGYVSNVSYASFRAFVDPPSPMTLDTK